MKLSIPSLAGHWLTAFVLIGAPLAAADVSSRAIAVTVYPDRALVTREASITIPAGETQFVLSDLPANLWDQSLQVRGTGPAGTTVLDVQSRNVFVDSTPTPRIHELEELLRELRREETSIKDRTDALHAERRLLVRIGEAATTVPEQGEINSRSYEEWQQLLDFQTQNLGRLATAQRKLDRESEDLQTKITTAENQLNEARGHLPGRRAVKQVTVRLAADAAGSGELQLSYTVPGAHWTPAYRARLDSATRRVSFDYEAQVTNRTGEAWESVALTLSTARPSAGGSAPEARPWIVEQSRYQVAPTTLGGFRRQASLAEMSDEVSVATSQFMKDLDVNEAAVETGLTSATFKLDAPASIAADGTVQKVAITTIPFAADLRHDSTPKYVPSAFLTATVTNNSDYPLLPGQLASFVDGAFIANSLFEQTMPGEEFDLALGVDEAVAVERTLVNRFTEETGLMSKGTRVTYSVKIELTNRKSIPVHLELAEPLPLSRHEDIRVRVESPAARDIGEGKAFTRDDEGILTWTGTLAPGATRDLDLRFSIEHPNDLDVSGVE